MKEYTKREVKLGREMVKESKTKRGQATDKKYVRKWMFYEQRKFLRPVMVKSKSRDSISTQTTIWNCKFSLYLNTVFSFNVI